MTSKSIGEGRRYEPLNHLHSLLGAKDMFERKQNSSTPFQTGFCTATGRRSPKLRMWKTSIISFSTQKLRRKKIFPVFTFFFAIPRTAYETYIIDSYILSVVEHHGLHPFHFGPRPFPFGNPLDIHAQRMAESLPFKLSGECESHRLFFRFIHITRIEDIPYTRDCPHQIFSGIAI